MNKVKAILIRDFTASAVTPRGGVLIFFFLFFMGIFYFSFIASLLKYQTDASLGVVPDLNAFTRAVFHNLHFILILVVPALTMATFSLENRTGVYRLLRVSPVGSFKIVIAKFLAVWGVILLLLFSSSPLFVWLWVNGDPDVSLILSSYFGVFLLSGLQIAIGTWVSSFTRSQFIAFIFTSGFLFLMLALNWVSPELGRNVSVSAFLRFVSSMAHYEPFLKGVLQVSHIIYFLSGISLFIFLTTMVLEFKYIGSSVVGINLTLIALSLMVAGTFYLESRGYAEWPHILLGAVVSSGVMAYFIRSWLSRRLRNKMVKKKMSLVISGLIFSQIVIGLMVLSTRPRLDSSVDITRNSKNTLSPQSIKVLKEVVEAGDLKVTGYFENEAKSNYFKALIGLYQRESAQVAFELVSPNAERLRAIRDKVSVSETVIFSSPLGQSRITSLSEEKVTNALSRLIRQKQSIIYFLQGHGEADMMSESDNGISLLVRDLEGKGHQVRPLNLANKGGVPTDAGLLISIGAKYDLLSIESIFLEKYLDDGGRALFLSSAMTPVDELNKLLHSFGMRINNDLILLNDNDPRIRLLGQDTAIVTNFDSFHPITSDLSVGGGASVILNNSRSVSRLSDYHHGKVQLLASTNDDFLIWPNISNEVVLPSSRVVQGLESGAANILAVSVKDMRATVAKFDKSSSKKYSDFSSPLSVYGKVAVIGASKFATNSGIERGENFDFVTNTINYLLDDFDLISIRPKEANAYLGEVSKNSYYFLFFICWVYPFSFLILAYILWWRGNRV